MTSLCDICPKPGNCCRKLTLSYEGKTPLVFWRDEGIEAAQVKMRELGLPFVPGDIEETYIDTDSGAEYVKYFYSCPMLLANGRCGIYDERPELCRSYEPGTDGLCVFSGAGVLREYVRREIRKPRMSRRRVKKMLTSIGAP